MFNKTKSLVQRLKESEQRVRELEAWKTSATAFFEKSHFQQVELAGEIMTSLKGGTRISRGTSVMQGRMNLFEEDFQGVFRELGQTDSQIADLDRDIATAAAAVDQTSAAIEQITASIARISQESTARYEDIRDLAALSKTGQAEMALTLTVIQSMTRGIGDLKAFLEIIDNIANRTSILAINAAIQAAHAGDVGRGFAVVASEVRKLAETSSANAAGIAKKLGGLIESIHHAEISSQKTSQILARTENKVALAAVGFQEIEHGARELSLGGQEILEGVSSLRQASATMKESSRLIRENSQSINDKVGHLRGESTLLGGEVHAIRDSAADLNGSGLVLSEGTVKQLKIAREFRVPAQGLDQVSRSILILQHLSIVTRVRSQLDGNLKLDAALIGDSHVCALGRWLEAEGKSAFVNENALKEFSARHQRLHNLARQIVELQATPGKAQEAEDRFTPLVEVSERVIEELRKLSAQSAEAGLVAWSPALELGHPVIDGQHRRLVDLLNRLFAALESGKARRILETVLEELVDYTLTHFREEEQLFLASRYPDKEKHLGLHREFAETVGNFQNDFKAGRVVLGSETMTFLKDWLVNHIQGTDREIVEYLAKAG